MRKETEDLIREKWLPALRSGNYKRGESILKNSETGQVCAIGVLCEQLVKDGKAEWGEPEDSENGMRFLYDGLDDYDSEIVLPPALVEELGIDYQFGFSPPVKLDEYRIAESVAQLNDMGCSFEQIADFIEETLDGKSGHTFLGG